MHPYHSTRHKRSLPPSFPPYLFNASFSSASCLKSSHMCSSTSDSISETRVSHLSIAWPALSSAASALSANVKKKTRNRRCAGYDGLHTPELWADACNKTTSVCIPGTWYISSQQKKQFHRCRTGVPGSLVSGPCAY